VRDRGTSGVSNVVVAAFLGMVLEGLVIDTDHWRHFYLIMAMIWGLAIAQRFHTHARRFEAGHAIPAS
jgi:sugar phosphate permease